MVSVYPNPLPGQDFNHLHGCGGVDPMNNNSSFISWNPGLGSDDPNKKVRKPYTITKSRESWTEQEHDKFLEALQLFDRDWKKIEAFVGSKTVIQIRSHAQKYFLKVQKNGTSEHVPPPRPKRKASHPYPQKAPKTAVSQAAGPLTTSAVLLDDGYAVGHDSALVPRPINNATLPPWSSNRVPSGCVQHVPKDDYRSAGVTTTHNYSSSSNDSTPRIRTSNETNHQVKVGQRNTIRAIPDFAQVYRFIGSVFDPSASDHLQRLKEMDPIDVETAVTLMKNLSTNLASPEFENHKKLLSSYNVGVRENGMRTTISTN